MANNNNNSLRQPRNQTIAELLLKTAHTATKSISRDNFSQSANYEKSYFGPYLVTIYVNLKAFRRVLTFLLKNNELINVKKSKQK